MENYVLEFRLKFEKIKDTIDVSKKKYYHFRSVSNFLLYLDMLTNEKEKYFSLEKLNNYFSYIENNEIDDVHESLALFNNFLKPIGELFEKRFGFFVMIKPWIMNFWIIVFLLIFWYIQNTFLFIFFLLILSLFFFYLGFKIKKKKVYAFMW